MPPDPPSPDWPAAAPPPGAAIGVPLALLRGLFDVAVAAADPMRVVPAALPQRPAGRTVVVGAGKASARMAEALESVWGPCEGLVITRDGYQRPCRGIEIVCASHPVPDARGLAATARLLRLVASLGEGDSVVALISGGASALMIAPAQGISLDEIRAINAALLASGAPIEAMNTVRKHLSRVTGGQLAAAAFPARMLALVISDVAGDDLASIASGPTVGDTTTGQDAGEIAARWGIALPQSALAALARSGVVRPGDPRLARCDSRIIAAPRQSLAAAAAAAVAAGCTVEHLGDAVEGEANAVGAAQFAHAAAVQDRLAAGAAPVVLLSGGECTVTRRGGGVGGPNAEFCLGFALAAAGRPGIFALACDTDGVDGAAEVAGAAFGPDVLALAAAAGVDAAAALAANDAHSFFAAVGAQVVTGPTLTNVNDFRALLIEPRSA